MAKEIKITSKNTSQKIAFDFDKVDAARGENTAFKPVVSLLCQDKQPVFRGSLIPVNETS